MIGGKLSGVSGRLAHASHQEVPRQPKTRGSTVVQQSIHVKQTLAQAFSLILSERGYDVAEPWQPVESWRSRLVLSLASASQ